MYKMLKSRKEHNVEDGVEVSILSAIGVLRWISTGISPPYGMAGAYEAFARKAIAALDAEGLPQ
jgi:hypothetical protein